MFFKITQHRLAEGWYEVMIEEKIKELIAELNEAREKKAFSKIFKIIKALCNSNQHSDELIAEYDEESLLVYTGEKYAHPFITIVKQEPETKK